MIVCQCNVITGKEIEDTVRALLREDAWRLVTPGMVYHALSKRGRCCGCFPGVVDIIVRTTEAVHAELETPPADIIPFIRRIIGEHERCETARRLARMRKAHRAA